MAVSSINNGEFELDVCNRDLRIRTDPSGQPQHAAGEDAEISPGSGRKQAEHIVESLVLLLRLGFGFFCV